MPNAAVPTQIVRLGAVALSAGGRLEEAEVAFEQYGELSAYGDNVILVCHALTGSARAAGDQGWWAPLIGRGEALDTERYAVICSNILGSCYGTTGPASLNPATGQVYGAEFPRVSVADMVAVQRRLLEILGVQSLAMVTGGSLGGLQVLEWAAQAPEMVRSIVPVAASLAHAPWTIGFNEAAREAIRSDPNWHGGDYARHRVSPDRGLSLARMIAMISYRSAPSFEEKFGRRERDLDAASRYDVEAYLHHQGQRLVRRFDANCYIRITQAMDDFDVGEGRGGAQAALAPFTGPATVIGISSDVLYPTWQQQQMADTLAANGNHVEYAEVYSLHGHDAFLMEWEQLDGMLRGALRRAHA